MFQVVCIWLLMGENKKGVWWHLVRGNLNYSHGSLPYHKVNRDFWGDLVDMGLLGRTHWVHLSGVGVNFKIS